jgi:hypothetical protein
MEREISLPCSQEPSTGLYPEPDRSSLYHPIIFLLSSILILSTHQRLDLPSGLFLSGFRTNILHAFPSPPFVLHALLILSSLTWSFSVFLPKCYIHFFSLPCVLHARLISFILTWPSHISFGEYRWRCSLRIRYLLPFSFGTFSRGTWSAPLNNMHHACHTDGRRWIREVAGVSERR